MKKVNNDKKTRLRYILENREMTQGELAKMTDLEVYQISEYCSGKRTNMLLDTAKKISKALGVTIDEAFADIEGSEQEN